MVTRNGTIKQYNIIQMTKNNGKTWIPKQYDYIVRNEMSKTDIGEKNVVL